MDPGDPIPAGGAPMGVWGTGLMPGEVPGVPGVPGATGRFEGEPLVGILSGARLLGLPWSDPWDALWAGEWLLLTEVLPWWSLILSLLSASFHRDSLVLLMTYCAGNMTKLQAYFTMVFLP